MVVRMQAGDAVFTEKVLALGPTPPPPPPQYKKIRTVAVSHIDKGTDSLVSILPSPPAHAQTGA